MSQEKEKKQRKQHRWETGDFVILDSGLIKILSDLKITNGKEIMLFGKILSLAQNDDKACTASNKYLSEFLCTTDRNVRNYLDDLKEKNLIKTYEKKEGLRTTTRYIYPQYTTLNSLCKGEEQIFRSSERPAEDSYQTSGTNLPKERKEFTKPEEDMFHHIKEYKRDIREENRGLADAQTDASLDNADAQFEFKSQFANFTDDKVKEIMVKEYKEINEYKPYLSTNEIIEEMVKTFTGNYYKCTNTEAVKQYATYLVSSN